MRHARDAREAWPEPCSILEWQWGHPSEGEADMSVLTRRDFGKLGGAAALAASLPIAARAAGPKVLRCVMHSGLRITDPIITTAYIARNHGYMIYDTLFAVDEHLQVQPQMVEHWDLSPDKLTYSFTLRPGLKFHDGAPVTLGRLHRLAAALGQARRHGPEADGFHRIDDPGRRARRSSWC